MITRTRWAGVALAASLTAATAAGPVWAAAAPKTDADFLVAVHQANLTEIEISENAQQHGASACVRDVADTLVRDHRRLDAGAAPIAARLGVALPAGPDAAQRQLADRLRGASGAADFDAQWLRVQAGAHQQALSLVDGEIAHGQDPSVVAAARDARPVVAEHLAMVRGGVCHAAAMPGAVNAGDGGQAAAAHGARAALAGGLLGVGVICVAAAATITARRARAGAAGGLSQ